MISAFMQRLRRERRPRLREGVRRARESMIDRFVAEWPRTHMGLAAGLAAFGGIFLLSFPVAAVWLLSRLPARLAGAVGPADWAIAAGTLLFAVLACLVTWQIARLRLSPPGTEVLEDGEAPRLFDAVDELCGLLGSAPVHRIVVTRRYEVELVRTPRSGFPLAFTNTLAIGLLVLLTLEPTHLRVLVARRIGQLAAGRHTPSGWLYILLQLWPQYRQHAGSAPAPLGWLLRAFFYGYVPLLRRLSRRAARQAELDADTRVLGVIDDQDVARALVNASVRERFLRDVFWPRLQPQHPATPQPRVLPYASMTNAVRGLEPAEWGRWLQRVMSGEHEPRTAQASLGERLDGIGYTAPPAPVVLAESAAHHYLGTSLTALIRRMDSRWFRGIMPLWNERYGQRQRAMQLIGALSARAGKGRLSVREAHAYAALAERLLPVSRISEVYRQLLSMGLSDADLNLRIGRHLLARGDEQGVVALGRIPPEDRARARAAARLLARYHTERGRPEAASRCLRQVLAGQPS